ncbi:MAG: hypothetical protein AUJ12_03310 [Alphaproteobacteria bacterium CG1_02_46_17]|nr:MAG: hypothetical protein AUJ12_03310 [Alphaproteobacteria bacterium CG1_02_46_17]
MMTDNKSQFTHCATPFIRPEDTLSEDILAAAARAGYCRPFINAEAAYAARITQKKQEHEPQPTPAK